MTPPYCIKVFPCLNYSRNESPMTFHGSLTLRILCKQRPFSWSHVSLYLTHGYHTPPHVRSWHISKINDRKCWHIMTELDPLINHGGADSIYERIIRPSLAEFFGTILFVFIGCMSVQTGDVGSIALSHGLTITLLVIGLGKVRFVC